MRPCAARCRRRSASPIGVTGCTRAPPSTVTVSAVPVLTDNYVWLVQEPESGETVAVVRLDDDFTGNARVKQTFSAMASGPGSKVLLSHSPDLSALTPPAVTLILSGHTHCGQLRYPWGGSVLMTITPERQAAKG